MVVANGRHWPEPNLIFFNDGRGIFNVAYPLDQIREPNRIYFGSPDVGFSTFVVFDTSRAATYSLTVTDLDLDGYPDLAIGNAREQNQVFLNRERGSSWIALPLREEALSTYDILATDLNGDGRPELIESNSDAVNRVYFNHPAKRE